MRLMKVREELEKKNILYEYSEVEECGSLDFEYRGLRYHVWEFHDDTWGADTNVRGGGCSEEILGDYEAKIVNLIEEWT